MHELHVPEQSRRLRVRGVEAICLGTNVVIERTLGYYSHYWFIDDDHEFHPEHLIRLLERNVDIVHGVTMSKRPPWRLSIFKDLLDGQFIPYTFADLAGKSGLLPVYACGRGGLLVRRQVFEQLERPYFQMGQIDPQTHNEDVHFSQRVTALGFTVHADLDNITGHTGQVVYYPHRKEDGTWAVRLMFTNQHGVVIGSESE